MSVPLLKPMRGHVHCIEDDLESTFWLFCYCLARYTDLYPFDDEAVMRWAHHHFDESREYRIEGSTHRSGGARKSNLLGDLKDRSSILQSSKLTHKALRKLFKEMSTILLYLHPLQVMRGLVAEAHKAELWNDEEREELEENEASLEEREAE